ncbi:general substrate transporter [Microdochium trichocladiopsis]|uniref:General substrate transporter n=1 Tax=Microdochium trichocladiopsis TaxID=1682393 RepID=A0A9P8XZ31_9PEZI|nr:general substrate transporter [Microdochium trichocladiopsis]KAH7025174.1 general substrate transporter [Microdochium trichocladiopsis]
MKISFGKTEAMADTPKQVFNWRLYWSTFVFGILGASRGLDEGLVGGMVTLKSFSTEFGLNQGSKEQIAQTTSNITSMVQLGSIIGALLAFLLCDNIGRIRSFQVLCMLWLVGFIIVITSQGSVAQVLGGRFIAGLGIGMTTVVGPTYLAETAPRAVRGMLTNIFAGSVYLGVMIAYFSNWGASINIPWTSRMQWVAPQTAHIGFAGALLIMSFTVNETPRYLTMKNQPEKAISALCKLRQLPADHPFVQAELLGIREQLEREKEATHGVSRWGKIRELLMVPANRYRLMLGCMSQILGQWSGASAITIYAPNFFATLGKTGESEKLFATCIVGVVKLSAAYLSAFFLIEFIGRRRSLYWGITLQMISILYVAIFLGIISPDKLASGNLSETDKQAATGAVAMLYISGVGWTMGWNSFQYLVNAEIWPLRLRALGSSLVMCLHFINQYGNTKAVPLMVLAMTSYGFFAFCAAVCFLGLLWVWFFVPELAGRSLESTDELFNLPWYKIGRHGAKTPDAEASNEHAWANEKDEAVAAESKGFHVEEARRD